MTQTTILVVEDESIVARDIQNCVSELGYESVGWAASGEEAIEKAGEKNPDLVLMDVRLPGEMDGISAAEEIRTRFKIPVVFLTAFGDEETLTRAKASGPFGYVLKPFVPSDLRLAIEFGVCRHQMESDVRKANQELTEQKGFLDALFNTIPSSVMVVDEARHIRMANRGLEQTFGVAMESAVDACPGDALGCPFAINGSEKCGTLEECVRCQLREPTVEALAGETVSRKSCEFTFFTDGQEHRVMLLVSAMPLDYMGERLAIVILEDVTELAGLRRLL
ncbi:MAG: response regulator, partial [Acidobacteriota bacterium]